LDEGWTMNVSEYKIMYDLENDHWYYIALRDLIFSYLKKQYPNGNGLKILDAGCGTGALLENLIEHGYEDVKGMDISEHALFYCKKRDLNQILLGSISRLPFRDNQFDLITSIDVICCLQVVDDVSALREFYRVLKSYGRLILHVPAYKFLMSEHDKATQTGIRYSKDDLTRKLGLAGFKIERITHRNSFLFPLVMIYRILKKNSKTADESKSDLKALPNFVNKTLIELLEIENTILKKFNFPFGSSIFCIAYKVLI